MRFVGCLLGIIYEKASYPNLDNSLHCCAKLKIALLLVLLGFYKGAALYFVGVE